MGRKGLRIGQKTEHIRGLRMELMVGGGWSGGGGGSERRRGEWMSWRRGDVEAEEEGVGAGRWYGGGGDEWRRR